MKKSLMLCGLLVAFVSCKDDTKELLKTVDGSWKVNTITYGRAAGPDSVARPTAVVLNFRNCAKYSNNQSPNNCGVNYLAGSDYFPFVYQADVNPRSLYINSDGPASTLAFQNVADQLIGSYEILTLNENTLIIKRKVQYGIPGVVSIQYSATR
jgi:hypothetical protein